MFNALNRFISRLDGDLPSQHHQHPHQREDTHGAFGFQVLRNTNLQLTIEPWFDFVVGINGRMIDNPDPGLFAKEVRNCAGGTVTLGLWSAKGQRTRALQIPVPADTASLGLTLQWTPLAAVSNIWHVLDVPANSPADVAGLLPYSDYILGSADGVLHGEGGLGELVEDHIGRPLRVYVYNNEFNVTRELTIQPSRDWGGEGALGCVLGYGALHRLPAPLSEPVSAPGETMFDGDSETTAAHGFDSSSFAGGPGGPPPPADTSSSTAGGEFLVPAQLVPAPTATATTPPPPPSGTGSGPSRTRKKDRHGHHHHGGGGKPMMDDYFREEEQKSKELDNAPSGRATPVAPPPKGAGGPPKAGSPAPPPPKAADSPKAEGEGT